MQEFVLGHPMTAAAFADLLRRPQFGPVQRLRVVAPWLAYSSPRARSTSRRRTSASTLRLPRDPEYRGCRGDRIVRSRKRTAHEGERRRLANDFAAPDDEIPRAGWRQELHVKRDGDTRLPVTRFPCDHGDGVIEERAEQSSVDYARSVEVTRLGEDRIGPRRGLLFRPQRPDDSHVPVQCPRLPAFAC